MGVVKREEGVLKLVHPGGVVECHMVPVLARNVMNENPRHCVTRPDVFTNPWIVVRPESVLEPGNVFYIVSYRTLRSLLRASTPPSSHFQHYQPATQKAQTREEENIDQKEEEEGHSVFGIKSSPFPPRSRRPYYHERRASFDVSRSNPSHRRSDSQEQRRSGDTRAVSFSERHGRQERSGCINLRTGHRPREEQKQTRSTQRRPHAESGRVHADTDDESGYDYESESMVMVHTCRQQRLQRLNRERRTQPKPCLRRQKGDDSRKKGDRRVRFLLPEEECHNRQGWGHQEIFGR